MTLTGVLFVMAQGAQGDILGLAEAVQEAISASPSARVAAARMEVASAAVGQTQSHRLPQVGLSATYLQTNNPMQAFGLILNQRAFSNDIDFNRPGQVDSFGVAVGAEQLIYSGGRNRSAREAAVAERGATEHSYEATLQRLSLQVSKTYMAILQIQRAILALESALEASQANIDVALERERLGNLYKRDLLDMEVQHANIEKAMLAARNEERLARVRLKMLLGRDAGAEDPEIVENDATIAALTLPAMTDARQRPELLALQSQVKAAGSRLKAAEAGRMPVAGAFASVQAERGWRMDGDGSSWTAGVKVELPLFDGFRTRAEVRSALAEQTVAREQLRELELQLEMELEQARLGHELAAAHLAVSRRQVESAAASAELTRERFQAGSLLTSDLLGAESQLVQAETALAEAFYGERAAVLELRRAAGLPLLDHPSLIEEK